jgi:hypothetical protein
MSLDPWIIGQLEEEERRRREDEDARRHRIELPQTRPAEEATPEQKPTAGEERVQILDISPRTENAIEL